MKTSDRCTFVVMGMVVVATALSFVLAWEVPDARAQALTGISAEEPPSLTVALTSLQPTRLPIRVAANGNILPWQEATIGAEANGLRLAEVKVNVGDKVHRGQLLATLFADTVKAELAQSQATVAEADVALAEAVANAQRARQLQETGVLSMQQIQQYTNAERTAQARLDGARAVEKTQHLRLVQTQVLAPDNGVISARMATVGAVVPAGHELFRLIRGNRLEWRAEVASADLVRLKPGHKVSLTSGGGGVIEGRVRMVGPVIDIQTRNGMVYVDLPNSDAIRAGMFARGEFEIGTIDAMTLPQSAVQLRDGFSYVMRMGSDNRIIQTKVTTRRRSGDRIEIVDGLVAEDRVVVMGGSFLGDGDLVRVSEAQEVVPTVQSRHSPQRQILTVSEGSR